jgi:hypothetical protein
MADNSQITLTGKFKAAIKSTCGNDQIRAEVYQTEIKNLCEKFDLLYDMADEKEKKGLCVAMESFILATVMQIRTQTTAAAVATQAEAAGQLFLKLQERNPEHIARSGLKQNLTEEAVKLKAVASCQTNTIARTALLDASNTVCLMVLAAPNARPAAALAPTP